ncbi:SWI5-dependent HO expression protein 4 [Kalmusia sp. IMI 367209]|nr:SWI5-dependent HO expression protein 4 [Kalmusia sp. IMI 367209]
MDTPTQDAIIQRAFDTVADDLLLSQNTLVRRAATELLCNLMASPHCAEKFADGSGRAGARLHLLCALTDVDDTATRSAAGGALAMLLSIDLAVMELLKLEKGVDFVLGLCRDENEHVRHRGVACVREVVAIGPQGIDTVKAKGGIEALKTMLKESRSQDVLGLGVETLKILLGQQ